ncbi:hypothetical protein, partial [Mesorhizobium sp.]|uniref:hypothetical protein n=1 Tax=Mesorhizobium sp. TaxID=1871066 RepID=UPI00342E392F
HHADPRRRRARPRQGRRAAFRRRSGIPRFRALHRRQHLAAPRPARRARLPQAGDQPGFPRTARADLR